MSKYIPGNQKHLPLDDRICIENSLNKSYTFKDVAKYLRMDPTTISKEIKAPYVCNGCDKKVSRCTIAHKYTYNARFADRKTPNPSGPFVMP
ncbi:MAG: helix-turn-helix domain-containing protein [Hungatella sp.]|jgi:IS30 family transposase|nr:helix-turn-helix domain-containing protein [Hungatella sp.]